jgi:hypothetical protein
VVEGGGDEPKGSHLPPHGRVGRLEGAKLGHRRQVGFLRFSAIKRSLTLSPQVSHLVLEVYPHHSRRPTLPPSKVRSRPSSSATHLFLRRAGLIRAASCIQLELDIEKKDIQIYSLHPGGVRTDMTLNALDPALDELLPGVRRAPFHDRSLDADLRAFTDYRASHWFLPPRDEHRTRALRGDVCLPRLDREGQDSSGMLL